MYRLAPFRQPDIASAFLTGRVTLKLSLPRGADKPHGERVVFGLPRRLRSHLDILSIFDHRGRVLSAATKLAAGSAATLAAKTLGKRHTAT